MTARLRVVLGVGLVECCLLPFADDLVDRSILFGMGEQQKWPPLGKLARLDRLETVMPCLEPNR